MTTANVTIREVLLKRGDTITASQYVGPVGEIIIDTGLKTIRLQDGVTPGGFPVAQGIQGVPGTQGNTGPQGIQGNTGTQGNVGIQGIQGNVGAQGIQGIQGNVGPQGSIGPQGAQGNVGIQGTPGVQGIQGPIGATGATGAAGPQGIQGVAGPAGNDGAVGAQGIQGVKGDTGATGSQGPKGDTGAQGIQGVKGDTGATGSQGPKGDTGATGPAGTDASVTSSSIASALGYTPASPSSVSSAIAAVVGVAPAALDTLKEIADQLASDESAVSALTTVVAGKANADLSNVTTLPAGVVAQLKGDKGNTGATGATGSQGVKGDTGAAGTNGTNGTDGATGATGPQGPQGLKGDTGTTGAQGPAGPNGATGATGATGSQGPQGNDGAVGAVGPQGPQGPAGNDGAVGAQGAQGPIGPQGATGATGSQGLKGDTGAAGTAGAKGDTGATGAIGPQGPAGAKGDTGTTGPAGNDGATGPAGNDGATGPAGNDGIGFTFYDAWANIVYVPNDVVTYQGSSYICTQMTPLSYLPTLPTDTSYWKVLAEKGDTGATGAPGNDGAAGAKGDTGATGAQGSVGPKGDTGATGTAGAKGDTGEPGTPGPQGPAGNDGAQGVSVTLVGNVAAPGNLPGVGSAGQGYIVSSVGNLFIWNTVTTTWNDVGPIVGPQGAQGPAGNDGAAGAQGIQGNVGPQGATGATGSVDYSRLDPINANITAANTAIITANTAMKSYVDAVTTAWTTANTVQSTQITSLQSSVTAANAAIVTANSAVVSYVNSVNSAMAANVAAANSAIISANTALKGYTDTAISTAINNLINAAPGTLDTLGEIAANLAAEGSAITAITNSITSINANVVAANAAIVTANTALKGYTDNQITTANTAMKGYVDSGNTTQSNQINSINANIGSYYTWANANVAGLSSQITGANAVISVLQANVGSYYTWANANVAGLQTSITSLATNANANTAAYLAANISTNIGTTGTVYAGNITVNGQPTTYGVARPAYAYVYLNTSTSYTGSAFDMVFDTIGTSSGIPYNTSTGLFSLTAGVTYEFETNLYVQFEGGVGYVAQYQWVDSSNNALSPTQGQAIPVTSGYNDSGVASQSLIYTPSQNMSVKVRWVNVFGGRMLIQNIKTWAKVKQLNPAVAVQATATGTVAANYAKYTRSAQQTGLSNGSVVVCNVLENTGGSSISVNTSTGQVTLTAGKTYRLIGMVPGFTTNGADARPQFCWYNETSSAYIGNSAEVYVPSSAAGYGAFGGPAEAVVTANATTVVSFRLLTGSSNLIGIGGNSDFSLTGSYPWIDIEEMGATFALNALDTISTTGNVTVGGNLNVTGTSTSLVTKASGIVNAGVDVTLGNLKARIPTSGNRSLQVSTVSGTYSISGSNIYQAGGVGGTTINGASPLSVTTTPTYLAAGENYTSAGFTSIWNIMDVSAGLAWRITLICGVSYNNNMISIERLV